MGKLFGTDGIRGIANEYPITSEMAVHVGRATALMFKKNAHRGKIIIGKDTRVSGDMLEYALASGICSGGADAHLVGTLPTPGTAFMTHSTGANAGIMISASHNPFYDNGIKIFQGDGFKLSDEKEAKIEQFLLDVKPDAVSRPVRETGSVYKISDAAGRYTAFLKQSLHETYPFKGMKLALDCSNGATYRVAPDLFADLGADVQSLFVSPNGTNINSNCGSQHPEALQKKVVKTGADIGLAFDGDGDRLIAVDEKGRVISGDQILLICANSMKQKGILKNNLVVSTVMSNIGLGMALSDMGIKHVIADVGDRYVLEKMIQTGAVIGGEDSGHIIFLDHHTTGDGVFSALRLLNAMKAESKRLSELGDMMDIFPQVLISVDVICKPDIETIPDIADAIHWVESELGKQGRVLVRYSGTQSLCRVMVEGPTHDATTRYCQHIADIVQKKLGK